MRAAAGTIALALALGACGCGKGDLVRRRAGGDAAHVSRPATRRPSTPRTAAAPRPSSPPDAAQAAAFSRAVNLRLADITAGRASRRQPASDQTEEERKCTVSAAGAVGGGESERFTRGRGLEREVISSGVAVLQSEVLAQKDMASVTSKAGIACYARAVRHNLGREENGLRIAALRVARLSVPVLGAERGLGIRLSIRIAEQRSGASIPLFIDALVLVHQSAELELYASSYVEPEPLRTEQELLGLMEQRARLSRL
jgi:hypothetical protein